MRPGRTAIAVLSQTHHAQPSLFVWARLNAYARPRLRKWPTAPSQSCFEQSMSQTRTVRRGASGPSSSRRHLMNRARHPVKMSTICSTIESIPVAMWHAGITPPGVSGEGGSAESAVAAAAYEESIGMRGDAAVKWEPDDTWTRWQVLRPVKKKKFL